MSRVTLITIFALLATSPSLAEERPAEAAPPTEEAKAKAVRGSTSYREGLKNVHERVEAAYDLGALAGAAHWEHIHDYYSSVARTKGCEQGMPYAQGPVEACHQTSGPRPKIVGAEYQAGKAEIDQQAKDTLYPDLVKVVLQGLYDYGYVQGMKHGLRKHNDDLALAQTYYRACMARATGPKGEAACSKGSKAWADELVAQLKRQVEAHGLPAGKKPE
jgi:hypothetical protein